MIKKLFTTSSIKKEPMIITLSVMVFILLVFIVISIYYRYKRIKILASRPIQNIPISSQFDIPSAIHLNDTDNKQSHYIIIIQPDNVQNIGVSNI